MTCKNCGSPLGRRGSYCSNPCQQEFQRNERIREWLETGQARVHPRSDHYVKAYLAKEQQNTCAVCGQGTVHNGMLLNFILDHIDGNSENNARENLRLVCPNCDSQLPTFKNRNHGNGRYFRRQRYANGISY
jgi:hypothetical protein